MFYFRARVGLNNGVRFQRFNYDHTMAMAMPSAADFNFNLRALCGEGRLKEVLHILYTTRNFAVNSATYLQLLQLCISKKALSEGKQIHSHINDSEYKFTTNKVLQNTLIRMYDKCGSLVDAREVFNKMTERDVFSWNVIIAAYRRQGCPHAALELFLQMKRTGFQPDQFTFASILPACAKVGVLEQGLSIHQCIVENGFLSDIVVTSALLDMYIKFGSVHKARELFNRMPHRDVVSWTAIIAGYAQLGFAEKALETFQHMQLAGITPNCATFASIVSVCAKMGALEQGTPIHQSIVERGFSSDAVVANALVDMYAKCGNVQKACELFKMMPQRDVVSWTSMVSGFARNGFVEEAMKTLRQMQLEGVKPNPATFVSILPACAKMGALGEAIDIHKSIKEWDLSSNVEVANALLDTYAKCGNVHEAQELFVAMPEKNVVSWNTMIAGYAQNGDLDKALSFFKEMPQRDVISWTAMIAGYAQNGFVEMALKTFQQMQLAGMKPNSTTFASILPACAKIEGLEQGMTIHQSIMKSGFLSDVVVANSLVDLYAKCGSIHKARKLFDTITQRNVLSWNAMIAGYTLNGYVEKALETFKQMQLVGVKPISTTFVSIFSACTKMEAFDHVMSIHQCIIERGLSSEVLLVNVLLDMYAKCGSIQKARKLFDNIPQKNVISWTAMLTGYARHGVLDEALKLFSEMPDRNVVSWTAMIAGYVQNGYVDKALETFKEMQLAGVEPDSTTFVSILPAYAKMGALEQCMDIHQIIMERGLIVDAVVANALVDMHAKCGSIHKAHDLFDKMPQKDLVSWTTMIAGYAQNGFCKDALKLFELMKHSGMHPDNVSFTCVLLACSHGGLVDDGCKYFDDMTDSYGIVPTIDHYVCMVDILSRAGYLQETLNFIIKMPVKPVVDVWMCLLGACRAHKNIQLGVYAATLIFELNPNNAETFVLLSNICADVGRWDEVQMLRRSMKDKGIRKVPGCSWVEGYKMVHAFCAGDGSHPQKQDLCKDG